MYSFRGELQSAAEGMVASTFHCSADFPCIPSRSEQEVGQEVAFFAVANGTGAVGE